jgi:8-oxo-dGTP pyrophosphatase MutT (NUDIX family)
MKLFEIAGELVKAGFIPYVFENGTPVFMFMTPSDPAYGGAEPGIAKGGVDAGEDTQTAGIREAEEELGLVISNLKHETIKLAWKGKMTGLKETYPMSVFMGEVKNKEDFVDPHYETGSVHWMTEKEFSKSGRKAQAHIVKAAARLLSKSNKL